MSDRQQDARSSDANIALEPGVRAARKRLGLSQEAVAELLNMSVYTYRGWDQGRHRPSSPEQVQRLSEVLKTPINVLWRPDDNPHVARALASEQSATVDDASLCTRETVAVPAARGGSEQSIALDVAGSERSSSDPLDLATAAHVTPEDDARDLDPDESATPTDFEDLTGCSVHGVSDDDLERRVGVPASGFQPITAPLDFESAEDASDVLERKSLSGASIRMLSSATHRRHLRISRAAGAIVVAGLLGLGAAVAATAVGGRGADDAKRTAATISAEQARAQQARQEEAGRRQIETRMGAAEQRGDFDAAIILAEQLHAPVARDGYRASAADVLVRRAGKAASRGDLPLARARLSRARQRYGTAPGSVNVQARIRRIEEERVARAKQKRAAAAEEARRAAARRAADAAPSIAKPHPTVETTPRPNTPSTASPAAPLSGSGGSADDSEEAVDPGLF